MALSGGEFLLITELWTNEPIDPNEWCIGSEIRNEHWPYGTGDEPGFVYYQDMSFENPVDQCADYEEESLFLGGIYAFEMDGHVFFKNVSMLFQPKPTKTDVWKYEGLFFKVTGGFVVDLESAPANDIEKIREILRNFGYDFCAWAHGDDCKDGSLFEQYEEFKESETQEKSFVEWLEEVDLYQIMDEDQLYEAEFAGPHWWFDQFSKYENFDVHSLIYEGVEQWRKEMCQHLKKCSGNADED